MLTKKKIMISFFYMIGSSPVDGPLQFSQYWSGPISALCTGLPYESCEVSNDCENWSGPSTGLDPVAVGRPDNKQNCCRTGEQLRSST